MSIQEVLFYEAKYTGQYILQIIKQNCGEDFYRKLLAYKKIVKSGQSTQEIIFEYNAINNYLKIYEFTLQKVVRDFNVFLHNDFSKKFIYEYKGCLNELRWNCILIKQFLSLSLNEISMKKSNNFIFQTCFLILNELDKLIVLLKF